jgi:hypothetical protein
MHTRLFKALPNDGSAPCLQDARAYKETSLPEIRIPHPSLVLIKITDLPFTYRFIVSRSASNKQPWQIIKGKGQDAFHFYLKRTPGYENITKDIKESALP